MSAQNNKKKKTGPNSAEVPNNKKFFRCGALSIEVDEEFLDRYPKLAQLAAEESNNRSRFESDGDEVRFATILNFICEERSLDLKSLSKRGIEDLREDAEALEVTDLVEACHQELRVRTLSVAPKDVLMVYPSEAKLLEILKDKDLAVVVCYDGLSNWFPKESFEWKVEQLSLLCAPIPVYVYVDYAYNYSSSIEIVEKGTQVFRGSLPIFKNLDDSQRHFLKFIMEISKYKIDMLT